MKPFSELTIALASDHAGFALKNQVRLFLEDNGAKVQDFGCYSDASCDYPDYAHPLAEAVEKGEYEFGIVICSTGNGICMTANKHQGIRAALCWEKRLAQLARQHNNANVLGTSSPCHKRWTSLLLSSKPTSKADATSAE